ncbi:MAG: hypothetical protein HY247_08200 [archaeon]|nr:MAG: hypothetical protein HY247_08200 [archaeon]
MDGASPVGAAPLDRRELSRVLGRSVGTRAHGSYALSIQQEGRMAPLRKGINALVEQFNASSEVKVAVKQKAERTAVKLMDELGPTKAAIASVADEFLRLGRNVTEVSLCISRVHPRIGQLKDLIVEAYPISPGDIGVLVNGRARGFKFHPNGLYTNLRVPLFVSDGGALLELSNARLTRNGYDQKRAAALGQSRLLITADERNFELFKVLEEARLRGGPVANRADLTGALRKYSISKLPLTEHLLREAGLLQRVSAEYAERYAAKAIDGRGRSPKKLAEEAVVEACESVVPVELSDLTVQKHHLRPSAMRSLVVKGELDHWQG